MRRRAPAAPAASLRAAAMGFARRDAGHAGDERRIDARRHEHREPPGLEPARRFEIRPEPLDGHVRRDQGHARISVCARASSPRARGRAPPIARVVGILPRVVVLQGGRDDVFELDLRLRAAVGDEVARVDDHDGPLRILADALEEERLTRHAAEHAHRRICTAGCQPGVLPCTLYHPLHLLRRPRRRRRWRRRYRR